MELGNNPKIQHFINNIPIKELSNKALYEHGTLRKVNNINYKTLTIYTKLSELTVHHPANIPFVLICKDIKDNYCSGKRGIHFLMLFWSGVFQAVPKEEIQHTQKCWK